MAGVAEIFDEPDFRGGIADDEGADRAGRDGLRPCSGSGGRRRDQAERGARKRQHRGAAIEKRVVESGHSRSEEHTSELQSLMRISYAVFCLNKKIKLTRRKHKYDT